MNSDLPIRIVSALDELTETQLRQLSRLIWEKLKLFNKARHLSELSKFNVLDRVFFDHHGERVTGTIVRLNQKSASVITDERGDWTVAPSLLHKMHDAGEEVEAFVEGEVIREQDVYPGTSRNSPCPCGSKKKYKKCCLVTVTKTR